MPELPEVDLVARSLNKFVVGKRISTTELRRPRLLSDTSSADFSSAFIGAIIRIVRRRGKFVVISLDNDASLITHLRMTGRFMILPAEQENPKHAHAIFYFDDNTKLVFDDQRHFGSMKIVKTAELANAREIAKLAPEPLSDDFSQKYFRDVLRTSKRSVKEFLLDQTKVCGVGNIYANEVLFLARINPAKIANKVSPKNADVLHQMIINVLSEAIAAMSVNYVDPQNIDGSYFNGGNADKWYVYEREELPCSNCEALISRIKQGGRSTFFCKKCQR